MTEDNLCNSKEQGESIIKFKKTKASMRCGKSVMHSNLNKLSFKGRREKEWSGIIYIYIKNVQESPQIVESYNLQIEEAQQTTSR